MMTKNFGLDVQSSSSLSVSSSKWTAVPSPSGTSGSSATIRSSSERVTRWLEAESIEMSWERSWEKVMRGEEVASGVGWLRTEYDELMLRASSDSFKAEMEGVLRRGGGVKIGDEVRIRRGGVMREFPARTRSTFRYRSRTSV